MGLTPLLATLVPVGLAVGAALYFDARTARSGLLPPAFRVPVPTLDPVAPRVQALGVEVWRPRRLAAFALIGLVFWLGIFLPLGSLGGPEPDLSSVSRAQLFLLHGILVLTISSWYVLGFAGRARSLGTGFRAQFGLRSNEIWKDLGIGLAAGIGAWVVVLLVLIVLGVLIWSVGGDEALPRDAPALVPWIAALPLGLRLGLSVSAGFAEELFFRGFLQVRSGVGFSTVLFVMAHLGYGQPLMLVGVTLLSLVFAALVRWRQNIWSAVVAHAVFDALQLLVVIPKALEFLEGSSGVPV